jgi:hypothetical protein
MGRRWRIAGVFAAAFVVSAACGDEVEQQLVSGGGGGCPPPSGQAGDTASTGGAGGDASTSASSGSGGDASASGGSGDSTPFEVPTTEEIAVRLHGCTKLSYAALGAILTGRGVNLSAVSADSAGALYRKARDGYGAQRRDSLRPERSSPTVPSLTWLYEIFLAAAPEIIANIEDPGLAPACSVSGSSYAMFDASGNCVREAISCLIGQPAKDEHVELCDALVDEATPSDVDDVERKQILAVGTILYAAHGCE